MFGLSTGYFECPLPDIGTARPSSSSECSIAELTFDLFALGERHAAETIGPIIAGAFKAADAKAVPMNIVSAMLHESRTGEGDRVPQRLAGMANTGNLAGA